MKNILFILLLFIFSCSSSDYSSNSYDETSEDVEEIEEIEEFPNTEIGTVEAFISNLGNQDYQAAYDKSKVKLWGSYSKFSSTKAFGGIVETRIDEIEQLPNENGKAVVYVEVFYADAINGDNSFKQKFFLQQFGVDWKIVKMKVVRNKQAKTTNINYSGEYSIEDRGTYVTVSKSLSVKKTKNNEYSFELSVAEGSDDEQMEAGGMGEFYGNDEGTITITSGKALYKSNGEEYIFQFTESSVKIKTQNSSWRIEPDGTYTKK